MKSEAALDVIDAAVRREVELGGNAKVTLVRRATGQWRAALKTTAGNGVKSVIDGLGVTPGSALSALADALQ